MNAKRKKKLEEILNTLQEIRERVEEIRDEEQESFDNIPNDLKSPESWEKMEDEIHLIKSVIDSIEDAELSLDELLEY